MKNNPTIFQFFHWYYSPEGDLWNHAAHEAARLAKMGVTHVWLPPAYKSARGVHEAGYAVYDLYDLGEFDQQGTVRTRYGTREEYLKAIHFLQQNGIEVVADIVLNHLTGADEQEEVTLQQVKEDNRTEFNGDIFKAPAHTRFTFPGRKGKYSDFIWTSECFTGVCEDGNVHIIHNQYTNGSWDEVAEKEKGNYDYLLGCDIEFRNPTVKEQLKQWGKWYVETTGIDAFRLDALKHINVDFFPEWLQYLEDHFKKHFFCIGEFWKNDKGLLEYYLDKTGGRIQLFDVPLHFNFYEASIQGNNYDLRKIFDNSLVQSRPDKAITFVDNHDTQPLQSLESTVDYWFKPLAYALILLREAGIPCVFYPAMYEAKYFEKRGEEEVYVELNAVPSLQPMIEVRRDHAYGIQRDYFDDANVIGWVREGEIGRTSGCIVIISNSGESGKQMQTAQHHAGKTFIDALGHRNEEVKIDEHGNGTFFVNGGSVSVWVEKQ